MQIEASCPTRIDFAGGTLDIYPLYVFENGAVTVNAAISLRSTVKITTRKDFRIHVKSHDLHDELTAENAEKLPLQGKLSFLSRIIRFYEPPCGLTVETENTTPAGSGLGSSSTLLIALSCALNELRKRKFSKEEIIDIGANLEAQEIEVPTGKQDYLSAMYGGVNAWNFGCDGTTKETLQHDKSSLEELQEHLILSYTGISRASAVTNWAMMRAYINKEHKTVHCMRRIKTIAMHIRECLLTKDYERLGFYIKEEWQNRKKLAPSVTTRKVNHIIREAEEAGAMSSKLCGAGGGGCLMTFAPKGKREQVKKALTRTGAHVMNFSLEQKGLVLKIKKGD